MLDASENQEEHVDEGEQEEHVDEGEQYSDRSGVPKNKDPDGGEENSEIPEPETCPYKVEDVTKSAGQHSRTVRTKGDAVDASQDEGKLGIGKEPPADEDLKSENAAQDADKTEQPPTESRTQMKSEYGLWRESMTPEDSICQDATISSKDSSAPLAVLKQESRARGVTPARQDSFEAKMSIPTSEDEGPYDTPLPPPSDLVVREFKGPQLYNFNEDHAEFHGSAEATQAHVQELIDMAIDSPHITAHGESRKLIRACRIDKVRQGLFAYLRDGANERAHRHNAAIKFLGACSYVINEHQGKVERDILHLATDEQAPETVRDQSILALMELSCPTLDSLQEVHALSTKQPDTPVGETATLALGVLLRKRRLCNSKIGLKPDVTTSKYESGFNEELLAAMKKGYTLARPRPLTRTLARMHACMHARTHARTHAN
jgi:hypothetical protein